MVDQARKKTLYLVLREQREGDTVTGYEPVATGVEGNNAEHALRGWADKALAGTPTAVYVAVPSRSFRPTKVTFAQQTVVKIGEAA